MRGMRAKAVGTVLLAALTGLAACSSSLESGGDPADDATGGSGGRAAGHGGTAGTGAGGAIGKGGAPGAGGTDAGAGGSDAGAGGSDAGAGGAAVPPDAAAAGGSPGAPDAAPAGNDVTGTYGNAAIKPVMSGLWLGKPANAAESAGGPFVALFSAPVTCADVSKSRGWIATIPAGTQVMELIIGTTTVGKAVPERDSAGPSFFEVNYIFGAKGLMEHKGASGMLTLTRYEPGVAVEGMLEATFIDGGTARGTFHADWCADGQEVGKP